MVWQSNTQQQSDCQIVNADESVKEYGSMAPHPTPHKTRLKITVKDQRIKEIMEENGGIPIPPILHRFLLELSS
jgi:hypothetical protein